MATDTSDVLKQCYLKIKSKNVGVWQKRWVILRRASSKGPYRLGKNYLSTICLNFVSSTTKN